jgi:hypothetical protein
MSQTRTRVVAIQIIRIRAVRLRPRKHGVQQFDTHRGCAAPAVDEDRDELFGLRARRARGGQLEHRLRGGRDEYHKRGDTF